MTIETLIEKMYGDKLGLFSREGVVKVALEFAKHHVKLSLEEASKKAKIIEDPYSYTGNTGSEYFPDYIVDKKSILESYPLRNIK